MKTFSKFISEEYHKGEDVLDPNIFNGIEERKAILEPIMNDIKIRLEGPPYLFTWKPEETDIQINNIGQMREMAIRPILDRSIEGGGLRAPFRATIRYENSVPSKLFIRIPTLNWITNGPIDIEKLKDIRFFVMGVYDVFINNIYTISQLRAYRTYDDHLCPYAFFDIYNRFLKDPETDIIRKGINSLEYAKKQYTIYGSWKPEWDEVLMDIKMRYLNDSDLSMKDWAKVI